MLASRFIAHLAERGVRCVVHGDRFLARGASTLPAWTKQALAAHRTELTRFLVEHIDQELKPTRAQKELRRLGFVHVRELNEWVHPRGNAVGDAILLGLISPEEVEADMDARAKDLHAPTRAPRAEPVEALREIPGGYRWAERPGGHYIEPFPRIPRLQE